MFRLKIKWRFLFKCVLSEPKWTSFSINVQDKDDDWDAEESDEEEKVDDDDLDISDDNDAYFKKGRGNQYSKGGRSLKSTRKTKSIASSNRRKKGRTFFEGNEESSAEESEDVSDEDFRSTRRGAPIHRKNGARSSVNISGRNNELRSSGRSVRKVSYVESDGSEDLDDVKKKNLKVCMCDWIFIFYFCSGLYKL